MYDTCSPVIRVESADQSELRNVYCQEFIRRFTAGMPSDDEAYVAASQNYLEATTAQVVSRVENYLGKIYEDSGFYEQVHNDTINDSEGQTLFEAISSIAARAIDQESYLRTHNYKMHLLSYAQEDDNLWQIIDEQRDEVHNELLHDPVALANCFLDLLKDAESPQLYKSMLLELVNRHTTPILERQDLAEAKWIASIHGSNWIERIHRQRKRSRFVERFKQLILI